MRIPASYFGKFALLLIGLAVSGWTASAASAFSATHLRCEYQTDPHAVGTTEPRLGWVVESGTQRGVTQSAYQILVASESDLLKRDQGDLWDSGKIASDRSLHVVYSGQTLVFRPDLLLEGEAVESRRRAVSVE
jgi:alpha-L-rhamnosidase